MLEKKYFKTLSGKILILGVVLLIFPATTIIFDKIQNQNHLKRLNLIKSTVEIESEFTSILLVLQGEYGRDLENSSLIVIKEHAEKIQQIIDDMNLDNPDSDYLKELDGKWHDEISPVINIIISNPGISYNDIDIEAFDFFQNDILNIKRHNTKSIEKMMETVDRKELYFFIVANIGLVISFLIFIRLSTKIINKTNAIREKTKNVLNQNFENQFLVKEEDELDSISNSINKMVSIILSEKKYTEAILDSFQDLILVTNSNGDVLRSNNKGGDRLSPLYVKNDNIQKFFTQKWESIRKELFQNKFKDKELGLKIPSEVKNNYVDVIISGVQMSVADEKYFVFFILDAENSTLAQKLSMQQKQLAHTGKLSLIGELAAGVGHEINNPLAIASGNVEAILGKIQNDVGIDSKELSERLTKVESANSRIRRIVDGLRISSRTDGEEKERFDIKENVMQTIDLVGEIYEKDGIQLEVELPAEQMYIEAHLGEFQQILMNLVSNAKDAVENKDFKKILVQLKSYDGSKASLSVIDNGEGIPDSIIDKILNPFFTTKKVGKGTGIGLGLVNDMVKKMGGSIEISSEVGVGSIFKVILPLVEKPIEVNEEIEPEGDSVELMGSTGKRTALVLDDEEGIRELLVDMMTDAGLEVDDAGDGEVALELARKKHYDFVFSDVKMPKMQGDDFIIEARKILGNETKYYFITGGVMTTYLEEKNITLEEISDGQLPKPFRRKDVLKIINQ